MAIIQHTIYVRASREQIRHLISMIPLVARGQAEAGRFGQIFQMRIGLAALSKIKEAFIVKSEGGTDEAGLSWKRLAKSTVAYSRRHSLDASHWVPTGKIRAQKAPSWQLTAAQRKRWWQLYRGEGGTRPQGRAYHAHPGERSWAAARAWNIIKNEGAHTLMEVYGDMKVPILRDTELLLNSLTPGVAVGADPPPGIPSVEKQVFRTGPGWVIVGTNRDFAIVHHEGRGHVPQRRLWPDPSTWPASWWEEIQRQGLYGLVDIALYLFGK